MWQSWIIKIRRLKALIIKELIVLLKDPGSRKILIVPALAQAVLFGYGATYNLSHVPWVLYDGDHSVQSAQVIRTFTHNPFYELVTNAQSLSDFQNTIDKGNALIGIAIPPGFSKDFQNGHGQVFIIADGRNITTANVAMNYTVDALLKAFPPQLAPITIESRLRYNENNITRWYIMSGMILAISMIQVLILSSLTVSREKENGSFDMMLMTPTTPGEIFIGKAIPPILVGIVQGLMIFAVCLFWFKIPLRGSPFTILALIALFSLSCVSIGIAISTITGTILASLVISFLLLVPMIVLSGLMTPVESMPQWLQEATIFNPIRYPIAALRLVYFEGASFADIIPYLWPMGLLFIITTPIAIYLFRRKVS
ncbi:hypothetical protein A6A19_02060 [Actinobacillus delphinicola]|uniref:ABC transporter permease n=1 Tax=Actinobacillus delphinicola TaxID=51161 RepID=UPI00244148EB|nr:ABC transporter permease [Actinobacillus delphinicola]MDG6896812.1 hypothetical protein [Actinobacillus delphinicola]